MARDSTLFQASPNTIDSDAASDAEQREVRLINAQNAVLTTIGVMAAGIGAQTDPPRRSHDLALGLGFISIQSMLVWPLDAWRMHMSVWQSPSWFAIAFRSVPQAAPSTPQARSSPPGRFPSAARPAMIASIIESTLWPASLIALHLYANSPSPSSTSSSSSRWRHRGSSSTADTQTAILDTIARTFAPGPSASSQSSRRPRQPHIPPLVRFLGPRIARYLAYPFRHTAMVRHLGHSGPNLIPTTYMNMILAPFTSYHLGSGPDPHPDMVWWAAHELVDTAEQLIVTAARMAMVKSREQRPKVPLAPTVVPPPPGLALLLLEAWVPPLLGKMLLHAPRAALWRAQLGLNPLPWQRLIAGIEPFVLAEIVVDWYLIEMSAKAMEWIKDWLRPPVSRGSSRSSRSRRLLRDSGANGRRSGSGSRSWVYPSSP